jgi:hypothetical protein
MSIEIVNAIFVGKPPFVEDNINRFSASVIELAETTESKALIESATNDWRAFVRDQFQLTINQSQAIAALSSVAVERIQRSINEALQARSRLEVIATPANALPAGVVAATKLEAKIEFAETIGPDNKLQHQIKISGGISC